MCNLLCSPLASGLFHQAVVQSCVDVNNTRKLRSGCDVWEGKSAVEWGAELSEALGCPRAAAASWADQLAAMRRLPASTLLRHTNARAATDCYESAVDRQPGSAKECSGVESLLERRVNRVPLLIGVTDDDG